MSDQSPYQEQWGFKEKHVVGYETISDTLGAYRFSAENIAGFLPDLSGKTVVDIGTGTGNSLCTILEKSAKPPALIIGLDPSADWLKLARYEIGKTITDEEENYWQNLFPPQTWARIKQQRQDSTAFKTAQELVQASGLSLPFADHSVDCLTACQSIHWLLLPGRQTPEKVFREFRRVLKPGGLLVFDESAFHLDFGNLTNNESVNLNDLYLLSPHSFGGAFLQSFNQRLEESDHSQKLDCLASSQDGYRHFTPEGLTETLAKAGFKVEFQTKILPYSQEQCQAVFRFDQDSYFVKVGMEKLTSEEKEKFLSRVFQEMGSYRHQPHEVFGYFVCRA